MSPAQISSWITTGMPSRVCSVRYCWISLARAADCVAVRLLAPLMRVMWPMPWASSGAARSGSSRSWEAIWNTHALPSCASFSARVMRPNRSATRSWMGAVGSR